MKCRDSYNGEVQQLLKHALLLLLRLPLLSILLTVVGDDVDLDGACDGAFVAVPADAC